MKNDIKNGQIKTNNQNQSGAFFRDILYKNIIKTIDHPARQHYDNVRLAVVEKERKYSERWRQLSFLTRWVGLGWGWQ